MATGPALTGGAITGVIAAGGVGAIAGGATSAETGPTWARSWPCDDTAWAVSKTGGAGAIVSTGVLSGGGVAWTGVTAAVAIASALADTGAPVWIPVSRLSARSLFAEGVEVWGERIELAGSTGVGGMAPMLVDSWAVAAGELRVEAVGVDSEGACARSALRPALGFTDACVLTGAVELLLAATVGIAGVLLVGAAGWLLEATVVWEGMLPVGGAAFWFSAGAVAVGAILGAAFGGGEEFWLAGALPDSSTVLPFSLSSAAAISACSNAGSVVVPPSGARPVSNANV
jgi:hypothetical protein